jgi:hypothetical protein
MFGNYAKLFDIGNSLIILSWKANGTHDWEYRIRLQLVSYL